MALEFVRDEMRFLAYCKSQLRAIDCFIGCGGDREWTGRQGDRFRLLVRHQHIVRSALLTCY